MSTENKTVHEKTISKIMMINQKELNSKNKEFDCAMKVINYQGVTEQLDVARMYASLLWATTGFENIINVDLILKEAQKNIFNDISKREIADALILASSSYIEQEPAYSKVSMRLLLKKLFNEVTGNSIQSDSWQIYYRESFINSIKVGIEKGILDKKMQDFDLSALAQAIDVSRDDQFEYMGLRTLYERYFTKIDKKRLELPQVFWMRVAMGLALNEKDKTTRTLEFYNTMSSFHYVPSTPTLLHAGLVRPQLSSCFLTTVEDDLKHIFKCVGDNAQLSKWSGGVANDWTNIRAIGAYIKSIQIESQGLIPFLRIANDVTAAINRSGSRRAATVVYLENWHLEVLDFLDLRKNTGDERRRTHDINTAVWIPDLFMKRVLQQGTWTLFSPDEVPELHHIYGKNFDTKYIEYETLAQQGKIDKYQVIEAEKLWRRMLSRLFETGHPWITFKDPCNVRSPQDHVGVVHSSNLCTEITLNTSADETAVCNLGSVNLSEHIVNGKLDNNRLGKTVSTAMRMLDNVIDINFYPTIEAQNSNFKHRPVGLGQMGFQDALYKLNIQFDSQKALEFADEVGEKISYFAILGSSELAKERGSYQSYKGSKWDRNIFPQDTIDLLEKEREVPIEVKREEKLDWKPVREHVKKYGMRNSNTMAIAPTATISNIAGCFPCIEPIYKNLYVKANMSGEFTLVNKYLVKDLKKESIWNEQMLELIKYYDGSIQPIDTIPQYIRDKYKGAFEIDANWLIEITATRGKWIDQSQSHNVFMKGVSGKKLSDIYIKAWKAGLKTMYYLRTLGATQIEKSTLDAKKYGYTQKREYTDKVSQQEVQQDNSETSSGDFLGVARACSIEDPDCEACQ